MRVFVRGTELRVFDCEDNETVLSLKEKLSAVENVMVAEMRLYGNGEPLEDTDIIRWENIDMNIGLQGGKVHGSLARAGKVKGQTPKVEKQEKKKKKTGRAKRRFQYNRRFVNIVQSFGRKRGPNAAPTT